MNINDQKNALRKEMAAKRALIDKQEKIIYDQWICTEIEKFIEENKCNVIHTYLPMGTEINLLPLIKSLLAKNKTIVCPKVKPKRLLENLILDDLEDLEEGKYGTFHPAGNKIFKGKYDLIIVPGLAYNNEKYRLGYGGGFYDSFIKLNPDTNKIGAFYPFQLKTNLPKELHDEKLDIIISK